MIQESDKNYIDELKQEIEKGYYNIDFRDHYNSKIIKKMLLNNNKYPYLLEAINHNIKSAKLTLPRENADIEKIANWYKKALSTFNSYIKFIEMKNGFKACCKNGCYYCCENNMISISIGEALVISHYVSENFNSDERKRLINKIKEQKIICDKAGIDRDEISYADKNLLASELSSIKKTYHDLKLKCVFLDENGSCMIYDVRPMDCLGFRQYVDEYFCKDAFKVIGSGEFSRISTELMSSFIYILKDRYSIEELTTLDTIPGRLFDFIEYLESGIIAIRD